MEIKIKEYLPFEDKSEIIQIAYQEAIDSTGFFDDTKFDILRTLYMIFYYTDLEFTDEEKAEPFKLYDRLYLDGTVKFVKDSVSYTEIEILDEYAFTYSRDKERYRHSVGELVNQVLLKLPAFLEGFSKAINSELLPALQKQVEELKATN